MNFLHWEFNANGGFVEVTLDKQANVRLLDDNNFSRFQSGENHQYFGGLAKRSPVRLSIPHSGRWHVVVDLGGYSGTVNASVRLVG